MDWLKQIRLEKCLSQKQVADAVNITQSSYSAVERGSKHPSVPLAKRIAKLLGFDWTKFYP